MVGAAEYEVPGAADEVAIRQLLVRYGMATDQRDIEALRPCLSPAFVRDFGSQRIVGREAFLNFVAENSLSDGRDGTPAEGPVTHFVGPVSVTVHGDAATAETYALAFRARPSGATDRIRLRAVRWHDEFDREDGIWRLRYRQVFEDWTSELPLISIGQS